MAHKINVYFTDANKARVKVLADANMRTFIAEATVLIIEALDAREGAKEKTPGEIVRTHNAALKRLADR